jgi:hypothetical protein
MLGVRLGVGVTVGFLEHNLNSGIAILAHVPNDQQEKRKVEKTPKHHGYQM